MTSSLKPPLRVMFVLSTFIEHLLFAALYYHMTAMSGPDLPARLELVLGVLLVKQKKEGVSI